MIKKTILLTGATGFLGSELLKYWLQKGHQVIILKRTTSSLKRVDKVINRCKYYDVDLPEWEKVFDNYQIDIVVHVAANYGKNGENTSKIVEANTLFPLKLLDFAIRNGVKEFINTGSSLPRDINAYALSKAHFHDWLVFRKNEIRNVNLALEYFYGAGDDNWKFISMVIRKLLNNEQSIDFSQGSQKRDFIYISDVISAFDTVLNNFNYIESGQTIPVGSGESYTLRSVVELCKLISGNLSTILNFGALPNRPGEVPELLADTSQLEKLGWKKKYSLKEGISEFIKNINKNKYTL